MIGVKSDLVFCFRPFIEKQKVQCRQYFTWRMILFKSKFKSIMDKQTFNEPQNP